MRVLFLGHRDVLAALSPEACAEAMTAALVRQAGGETYMPLRSVMMPPEAAGFMGLMPGWRGPRRDDAGAFALKAVCIMPGNPARGLDAHQGLVTLFDGETGVPTAILDAAAITEIRTAAVTAVATSALARRDARTLAILGPARRPGRTSGRSPGYASSARCVSTRQPGRTPARWCSRQPACARSWPSPAAPRKRSAAPMSSSP